MECSPASAPANAPSLPAVADPRVTHLLSLYVAAYQVASRVLRSADAAEDVVQTAYLKVLGHLPENLPLDEVQPWFFAVVVNTARELLRSDARRRHREEQVMQTRENSTTPAAGPDREVIAALRTAVENLDDAERLPVVLCHEQGLTQAAAAQVLGLSPRLVSVHLAKAVDTLRATLTRAGITASPAVILSGLGHTAPMAPETLAQTVQQMALQSIGTTVTTVTAASATASTAAACGKTLLAAKLLAISLLAVTSVVVIQQWPRDTTPAPTAPPAAAVQPVAPQADPPAAPPAPNPHDVLQKILDTKIDAEYRRASLSEVLSDLKTRTALHSAYPPAIDGTFYLRLEQPQITVGEVLKQLAAAGKLDLEFYGDTAVFWKLADNQVIAALEKKLKEGTVDERCEAAYDLGNLADKRAGALLAQALNDADTAVVFWAIDAMVSKKSTIAASGSGKACYDSAARLLNTPAMASHKPRLIQLIGSSRDPRAVAALQALLQDPSGVIRSSACAALGFTRDPLAVDILLKLLNDPNLANQQCAFTGLAGADDPRVLDALLNQLKNPNCNPVIRQRAFSMLGQFQDPRAVEPLIAAALNEKQHDYQAMNVLAASHDPHAIEAMITLMKNENKEIRMLMVDSICVARAQDRRLVEPVIALLQDKDSQVQALAAVALGRMPDPRTLPPLETLLKKGSNLEIKGAAMRAMALTYDPEVIDKLIAQAKDADPKFRAAATVALGLTRDSRAVKCLVELMRDEDPEVRRNAATALCSSHDPQVCPAMIPLLQDPLPNIRFNAARVLLARRDSRALPLLIALLKDPATALPTVQNAMNGIATLDPRAVPPLIALLKDPSANVRTLAAEVLRNFKDPRADMPLAEFDKKQQELQHPDEF